MAISRLHAILAVSGVTAVVVPATVLTVRSFKTKPLVTADVAPVSEVCYATIPGTTTTTGSDKYKKESLTKLWCGVFDKNKGESEWKEGEKKCCAKRIRG